MSSENENPARLSGRGRARIGAIEPLTTPAAGMRSSRTMDRVREALRAYEQRADARARLAAWVQSRHAPASQT